MTPKLRTLTLFILLTAAWLLPQPAAAQNSDVLTVSARAGLDGLYQQYAWTPVTVTVANSGPAVAGKLTVTRSAAPGSSAILYEAPINLPTQSNKEITLYVYLSRFVNDLNVTLLDDNGNTLIATQTNALRLVDSDHLFYGVVTGNVGSLDFLQNITGGRPDAAVAYLTPDALPDIAAAWRPLDVVVLSSIDSSRLTPDQQAALRGWVATGGELVITGGLDWQLTTAVFDDMLPVAISGVSGRDDLPALRAVTGEPFRDPGPYMVTDSSLTQGELLLHEDGLPLLARRDWGQGSVYFLALDPTLAPLLDWNGRNAVFTAVTDTINTLPKWAAGAQNGYSARSAISRLPNLTLPSVLQLVFFLTLYTIVMGPVNYLILKRRNRLELAWITIPVLVLIFTAVTYFTGFQIRGNEIVVNEMTVAYGQVDADTIRAQNLIGLYSPRRDTFDVSVSPGQVLRPFTNEIINSSSNDLDTITWNGNLTLQNVQVDIGEVATFVGETTIPRPDISGSADLRIADGMMVVDVQVQNNSGETFEAASLIVAGTAVAIGDIAPGERVERTLKVGAASATATPGGAPIFAPTSTSTTPLTQNPTIILGSGDYYDDPVLYARWELLQAIDNVSAPSAATSANAQTTGQATLIGWTSDSHLPITLNGDSAPSQRATSLYFLDLPLSRQLQADGPVSVPLSFLDWTVTEQVNVYDPSVQDFYLPAGVVAFSYTPWPEFQAMAVEAMTIILESSDAAYATPPLVELWHWQAESWEAAPEVVWGQTAVSDYGRFLGPDNTVRIRLEMPQSEGGAYINSIYPLLTGNPSE